MICPEYIRFFEDLMSSQKNIREKAEKEFEMIKSKPIEETINIFKAGMSSNDKNISQLASLMFKKAYIENFNIKSNLTKNQIENLIKFLKSFLNFSSEKEWKFYQRIGESLGELYQISDMKTNFQDIIIWFNNSNPTSREFAIFLIEILCDIGALNDEIIKGSNNDFINIFSIGLNDKDLKVRVETFKSIVHFLINLKNEENIILYTQNIDNMLNCLLDIVGKDNTFDKSLLESLNNLTDTHPKFWKEKFDLFVDTICKIIANKNLDYIVRTSALELIYTLSGHLPAIMRKSKVFQEKFLPLMFDLLLEIDNENDLDSWEKSEENDEMEIQKMYYVIRNGFDTICMNLGGKYFWENVSSKIKENLLSDNWIKICSGFTAICYMCEGCKKLFSDNLKEILNFISNGLIHSHPRVRCISLKAFSSLLKYTAPKIQKEYTNNILPALANLMSSKEPSLKVKSEASSTLVQYLKGLIMDNKESENALLIIPYAEELINFLVYLFEQSITINYQPLQEYTLISLSLLSNILGAQFSPFYEKIMPGLKKLFYSLNAITPQQKTLKSQCIETISCLFSCGGEENNKYMDDLKEISDSFAKYFSTLKDDDIQIVSLLNAFTLLSLPMKDEFIPILDFLFPILSNYIKTDIGFSIKDAEIHEFIPEEVNEDEKDKVGSVMINLGVNTKKLSFNTFALQNKILSLKVLNDICMNMENSFYPYTEKFLNITKDLLKYSYSRKIRKYAINSIYSCMNACNTEEERGKVLKFVENEIIGVFNYNVKSSSFKEIKSYLKAFGKFSELIEDRSTFSEFFITNLYKILNEIVNLTKTKIIEILNITKNSDGCFDENDEEDQKADINQLNYINKLVMELNGKIIKIFGENLTDLVNVNLIEFFKESWEKSIIKKQTDKSEDSIFDQIILTSIDFFNDFLEYCTEKSFDFASSVYMEFCSKSKNNEEILKSIVHGYGIICKKMNRDEFEKKYKNEILNLIDKILSRPKNDSNIETCDNAVSALGQYIFYKCDYNPENVLLTNRYINLLPLKGDLEEGKNACKEFLENINENNELLLDEKNRESLKEAVERIISLNKKESFLEDESLEDIIMACMNLGIKNDIE